MSMIQTYKGWVFVALSAILLTTVARRELRLRERAEELLQEEKERARVYLDVANVLLVVLGNDGRVRLVNRKGADVVGLPEEEIVGLPWIERFIPEAGRQAALEEFRRLLGGVKAGGALETPVLTRDGKERLIAWQYAVIRDERGGVTAVLASGEDVTDRRRAES